LLWVISSDGIKIAFNEYRSQNTGDVSFLNCLVKHQMLRVIYNNSPNEEEFRGLRSDPFCTNKYADKNWLSADQ